MKSFIYEVANDLGIHARPAANLAQACVNLASAITIKCGDKKANGNNVLQILALNAKQGAQLEISAEGGDEEAAIEAIKSVLADEFSKKKKVEILKIAFFGTKDYDRLFFSELSAHVLHLKQPVLQRATTQSASSLMMRLREKLSRHSKSAALNLSFSVAQASTMLIFRQLKNAALPLSVFRLIHRTQLPSMQSPSSHALTEDFTRLFRRSRTTTSHSADFSAWTFTTKLPVSWAQVRSDSAWQESARDSA